MNSTGKLIFALVIAANLTAIAVAGGMNLHRRAVEEARVIPLAKIVVTPPKTEVPSIELATIVVTPTEADWRFAAAHGRRKPGNESATGSAAGLEAVAGQDALAELLQSMAALNPGKFLDTGAALRALNTLAFGEPGR